jgi:hypothetical protein
MQTGPKKKKKKKLLTGFVWLRIGYNENTVMGLRTLYKTGNFRLSEITDRFYSLMWKVKVLNYDAEYHTCFVSLAANDHHYVQYTSKGGYGTRRKERNKSQNKKKN